MTHYASLIDSYYDRDPVHELEMTRAILVSEKHRYQTAPNESLLISIRGLERDVQYWLNRSLKELNT
jgi:hypothetical protein